MTNNFRPESEYLSSADKEFEKVLRPLEFSDFSGQENIVENLRVL
jgi:Holliday junction DNA helicase RuvB